MHYLDLHIPEGTNPSSFEVRDTSIYDENLPISNAILEIYPPKSRYGYVGHKTKGFSFIANAHLLKINAVGGIYPPLPDGVYRVKYSIKPNDKVYVEFIYFRNTIQLGKYYDLVQKVLDQQQYYPRKLFFEKQKELLWIKELLVVSKRVAEDKRDIEKANLMYEEIDILIKDFRC